MAHETENERNATQHIRIAIAELIEDRRHTHSREDIAAFLNAELDRSFQEGESSMVDQTTSLEAGSSFDAARFGSR